MLLPGENQHPGMRTSSVHHGPFGLVFFGGFTKGHIWVSHVIKALVTDRQSPVEKLCWGSCCCGPAPLPSHGMGRNPSE